MSIEQAILEHAEAIKILAEAIRGSQRLDVTVPNKIQTASNYGSGPMEDEVRATQGATQEKTVKEAPKPTQDRVTYNDLKALFLEVAKAKGAPYVLKLLQPVGVVAGLRDLESKPETWEKALVLMTKGK